MTTNIPAGWALVPLETLSRWRKWCLGYEWPKGQDWESHDVYLAIADEIRTKYEDATPPVDAVPGEPVTYRPSREDVMAALVDVDRIRDSVPHWKGWSGITGACERITNLLRYGSDWDAKLTTPTAPQAVGEPDKAKP